MRQRVRGKRTKPLKRTAGTKPVRKTFRVYTEGASTEPEYLDALKRLPEFADSNAIDIVIEQRGASPMTLVESARTDKRNSSLDIDFYWCVFDVESPKPHPNLDRARNMARDNGVHLAISNPCFELWLILHHRLQAAHLTTDEAVRLRAKLDGSDGKHLDPRRYMETRGDAIVHAQRLRRKHRDDGSAFPADNPSTSFDEFLIQLGAELQAPTAEADTATASSRPRQD